MSFTYLNTEELLEEVLLAKYENLSSINIICVGWPRTLGCYDGTTWRWRGQSPLIVDIFFACATLVGTFGGLWAWRWSGRSTRFTTLGLLSAVSAISSYLAAHEWKTLYSPSSMWYGIHDVAKTMVLLCVFWTWYTLLNIMASRFINAANGEGREV